MGAFLQEAEGPCRRPRRVRARPGDRASEPERHRRPRIRGADFRTSRSRAGAGARVPRDAELGRSLVGIQERHARSCRPEMAAAAGPQVRRLRIAAILVGASVAIIGAEQQPVFRASVDVVRIDVSVMNGLNPVAGLKAENFVVTDNGVPQTARFRFARQRSAEPDARARYQRQPGGGAVDPPRSTR